MPADPQEFSNRLISALATAGADSDAVNALRAEARAASAAQGDAADEFVRGWKRLHTPGGAASTSTAAPPSSGGGLWGGLSIGAIVTALGAAGVFKWDTVGPFLQSLAKNPSSTGLLVLVAVAGGLGGLLNGWLAGSITWLPGSKSLDGTTSSALQWVFCPGVVGNALTGAVGAVVAVWLPTWSHFGDPSSTRILGSSIVAAVVVGLGGSRVLTGQRDKTMLLSALQQAVDQPRDPKLAEDLGKAPTALKAVELFLGRSLSAPAAPTPAADPAATEAYLLSLLDPAALNQHFVRLRAAGKPTVLTPDGAGLELGALNAVKALGDRVPGGVQHFRIADAARLDRATFRTALLAAVPGAGALPVEEIWQAAQDAAATLARMPANWQLRPTTAGA